MNNTPITMLDLEHVSIAGALDTGRINEPEFLITETTKASKSTISGHMNVLLNSDMDTAIEAIKDIHDNHGICDITNDTCPCTALFRTGKCGKNLFVKR